jgi:23S rRNA (adenine2503-C2)-methyltransferase
MSAVPSPARYGATKAELETMLTDLGEPRYRVAQLHQGLWEQRRPLEDLTNLPRALRTTMAARLPLVLDVLAEQQGDGGMTTKWLWRTGRDGAQVETVLMRSPRRATVCVSSQAGCAMACTFCATGQMGFERHLQSAEICEQVMRAQHASPSRVTNVVYMGMGEPLANVDAVIDSLARLHRDAGFSARHLTVSTVGVVPGMRRLAELELPVTLAVSLHAPDDALREQLVPLNHRYPIVQVLEAARAYAAAKGRRVTFEYAAIEGVNDHPGQADQLARLLTGFRGGAHVNLIPLNPTGGFPGRASPRHRLEPFAARLEAVGVRATIRRNRGVGIDAACGQLRSRAAGGGDRAPASATMGP